LAQVVDGYEVACLEALSFVGREGKVIQKGVFPSSHHITITEDHMKFQEMFDQAMHHALINQSKVMMNYVQNIVHQMISGHRPPQLPE